MVKRISFVAPFICLLLLCQQALAQTADDRKSFEVGAHFSVLRFDDYGEYGTEPGVGGRFGYNFNDHVAAEAEVTFYPRAHVNDPTVSGRKTLALFGVKLGARRGRFGLLGKARPGFIHLSRNLEFSCIGIGEPVDCELSNTSFAFDLGGVVEYHFSPRFLFRTDLGDTIIRSSIAGGTDITHNLQLNLGFGFRF